MEKREQNALQHVEFETNKLISRAGEGAITELDLSILKSWIEKIQESKVRTRYEKIVDKICPIGQDHQIKKITELMQMIAVDANLPVSYEMRALSKTMQNLKDEDLMYSFCEYLMHSASAMDHPKLSYDEIAEIQKQFRGLRDVTGDELNSKFYFFLDLYNSIVNP